MKSLPQIQRLRQGESPLSVFNKPTIQSARKAFRELRKKFDFPFWAANEYHIKDINDPDNIIPLKLNSYQHHIIDTMQKRYSDRQTSRYIITKSFQRCGLTTCVQAYQLWLQIFKCQKHSFTCSASDISINPLKTNLCRYLNREIVPQDKALFIPQAGYRAFFNTFRTPDYIRGIDLGYLHLADMAYWPDKYGELSSRVFAAANSSVLNRYDTLVVLEGNVPTNQEYYHKDFNYLRFPFQTRMSLLSSICRNPFFLDNVAITCIALNKTPKIIPFFHHIHLSPDPQSVCLWVKSTPTPRAPTAPPPSA